MPYPSSGQTATSVSPGVVTGWQDWNDSTTAITPITLSGTPAGLTNDGVGPFTNTSYRVNGHGDIWDVSSNRFDWSSLALGDTVDIRIDVTVTTSAPNTQITTSFDLAIGGASPYVLNIDTRIFKSAGTNQVVRWYSIYMGDNNTLDNPARLLMVSDGSGDTVVVNGWYVRTLVR